MILSKLFRGQIKLFLATHDDGKWSFIPSGVSAWEALSEMFAIPKFLSGGLRSAKVAVRPDGLPTAATLSHGCGQNVRECGVASPEMVLLC
jgi:hypothetical protein